MLEIRVAVGDAVGAQRLLGCLAGRFDRSAVSFDRVHNEVRVRAERESRAVVEVITTVQSWLTSDGVASARLSIGERSYTMVGALPGAR